MLQQSTLVYFFHTPCLLSFVTLTPALATDVPKIETEKNKFYFYSFNLQKIYTREKVERKKKQKERVNNWVKGTPQQRTILFWDLFSF